MGRSHFSLRCTKLLDRVVCLYGRGSIKPLAAHAIVEAPSVPDDTPVGTPEVTPEDTPDTPDAPK